MSLIITQGPLPQDGQRVDASTFLEEWVSNTDVRGLDGTSFGDDIQFVVSQTDTAQDRRAGFWFERGRGQLYFRDNFNRSGRYATAFNAYWMGLAPLRTFVAEALEPAQQGGIMFMGETGGGPSLLNSFYEDSFLRRVPTFTQSGVNQGNRYGSYVGLALESRESGLPVPLVDWGFCEALIASGGSNVTRLAFAKMHCTSVTEPYPLHPRNSAWTGETGFRDVGLILETNVSTQRHLALIYKKPNPHWVV